MEPSKGKDRRDRHALVFGAVIIVMVAVTAAATGVGFWLSYAGLHGFALRAGLRGPEAWAWPASVDLFISAGEAGVTLSALRRKDDWVAWVYLVLGAATSVTANVLHVDPAVLRWLPYAVAAVPPVAAVLALASLLRQVYQLAVPGELAAYPAVPAAAAATPVPLSGAVVDAGLLAWLTSGPGAVPAVPEPPAALNGHGHAAVEMFAGELAAGRVPGIRAIRSGLSVGQDRARQVQAYLRELTPGTDAGAAGA